MTQERMTDKESRYIGAIGWRRLDVGKSQPFTIIDAREQPDGSVECLCRFVKTQKREIISNRDMFTSPEIKQ